MPDGQGTIDQQAARNRRGQQLKDRRNARFGCIYRRMLLWVLDDHIGSGSSWEMTFADLADESEMSISKAYEVADELRQMSLIDFREVEPNSARYEFRIIRSNVSELAEQSGQVPPRRSRGRPRQSEVEKSSTTRKTFPHGGKPFHHTENLSTTRKTFPHGGNAPYIERPLTTPTPSTPAGEPPATWVMVEGELLKVGIQETEKPLHKMRQTGCCPDQALTIIRFWQKHPGRWSEGKLRRRLINLRPNQEADDLTYWPPADEQPSSPGSGVLDMQPEEIRELIRWVLSQNLNESQRAAWSEMMSHDGISNPRASGFLTEYRPALEAALERKNRCKAVC